MSRRKLIGWVIGVLVLMLTGSALWTLREPLQKGLGYLQNTHQSGSVVRFAVIGDNHGMNDTYRQAIKELADQPVAFLLNLADTSEFGTEDEFTEVHTLEKTLPYPVYHTLGNHDIKSDPTGQTFSKVFGHEPNYSFTSGSVHVVILNNADRKIGFSQETLDWLKKDLAANGNSYTVLAYHRPFDLPLAAVIGDDETKTSRASIEKFLDIIHSYPIKYIFTAHVHTYLKYFVDDIPAVVSGGGGDPAQTLLGGPAANYFHYLIVTIKNGEASIELHRL